MKLEALDQVHISAVSRDSLRAGQSFEVSDAVGEDLLKRHPTLFRKLEEDSAVTNKPEPNGPSAAPIGTKPAGAKAEAAPLNKAAPPHSDKADRRRKSKK
jgi:hypothetical protein